MTDIVEKWGKAVAERGFSQIPNYLLLINNFLDADKKLTPVELLVLLQLVGAWWQKNDLPFPSMATLAKRMGVSERQIQRAVARLVKDEFIAKVKRRSQGIIASNAYDLSPLVQILDKVAKAFPNEFPRVSTHRRAMTTNSAGSSIDPPRAKSKQGSGLTSDDAGLSHEFQKRPRRNIQLDD